MMSTTDPADFRSGSPDTSNDQASTSDPRAAGPGEPLAQIEPIPVRVSFERSEPDSRWGQSVWRVVSVDPGEPGDLLEIRLFKDESQGYYLNVTTPEPSIFVMWRGDEHAAIAIEVTLSYDEAGRWMDGGEHVDRVPMPEEMIAWLTEYVRLHYQPETGRKRRGAKPSFMRREEFEQMARREAQLHRTPGAAADAPGSSKSGDPR